MMLYIMSKFISKFVRVFISDKTKGVVIQSNGMKMTHGLHESCGILINLILIDQQIMKMIQEYVLMADLSIDTLLILNRCVN